MVYTDKLSKFQKIINYKFKNKDLLIVALTHKSYAYEKDEVSAYNERIEFLGDAILEHIISEKLYDFSPEISEGMMTRKRADIVCEASLARAMKRVKAEEYILLGKCEAGGPEDAVIADAFEAILGAIYKDGGYEKAKEFVFYMLEEEIDLVLSGKSLNVDYKTKLQEILQKNGNVKIEYVIMEETGLQHDKRFKIKVLFNGKKIGEGIGKSKKQAQQQAAKDAIKLQKYKA